MVDVKQTESELKSEKPSSSTAGRQLEGRSLRFWGLVAVSAITGGLFSARRSGKRGVPVHSVSRATNQTGKRV